MAEKKKKEYVSDNARLMAEWNWKKNDELGMDPQTITCGSEKKAWWICGKGHEWQAITGNRARGRGCPYCSGQRVLEGENDLQTVNPLLAREWNYQRNNGLTPAQVMPNSDQKVWWVCSKGHEWQTSVAHRNNGRGCPICDSQQHTSFPEYALVYYLRKYGLEVQHSYKEKGYELDLYIPSKKVAIEYDGYFWHKNKIGQDLKKNSRCVQDGIKLYRIREELPPLNNGSIDHIIQRNQMDLPKAIEQILFEIIGFQIDIDIKRDYIAIENLRVHIEKENSLWRTHPQIAKEWNYEKNGDLKPTDFTSSSGRKVWWRCNKGHEWQASIANRSRGTGCPYCSGKKVLIGYNDLFVLNPILAKEWNYEKNGDLKPTDFVPNSKEKVWWICAKGHEWQAHIYSRNAGNGCPFCAGQKVSVGNNDLQTANPSLAKEWNYEKNGTLKPIDFTANSNKKVWWICAKGHEWQASINGRAKGHKCPFCSGNKVLQGYNDLQTVNPFLAEEWNCEKNGNFKPIDFTANSSKKVWWRCAEGHEWQAEICSRSKGHGCPYCAGLHPVKGESDLQTVNLFLAKEWNYDRNGTLKPSDVLPSSGKKVWWKCAKGHEWQAMIAHRSQGHGCPYCSGRYAVKGENDLQTVNPTLANEWHYARNEALTPADVTPNSGRKVWWLCAKGHEWQATIIHRNNGRGCPECAKQNRKKKSN